MEGGGGVSCRRPAFLLRCLLCNCRVESDLNAGCRLLAGLPCGQFLAEHVCGEAGDECRVAERVCDECFTLLEQWQSMQRILEKLGCSISDKYRRARLKRRSENVCICVGRLAIHLRYAAFLTHIKGRRLGWHEAVRAVATSVLSSAAPATASGASSQSHYQHQAGRHRGHQQLLPVESVSSDGTLPGRGMSFPGGDSDDLSASHTDPAAAGVSGVRVLRPVVLRAGGPGLESGQRLHSAELPLVRLMHSAPSAAPSVESDVASVCSTDSSVATVAQMGGSGAPAHLAPPAAQQLSVLQNWSGIAPPLFHHPAATAAGAGGAASGYRRVGEGGAAAVAMSLAEQLVSAREREETMSVLSMADTASLLDRTETLSLLSDNTDTTARLDEFCSVGPGSVRSGTTSVHGIDSGVDTSSLSRGNNINHSCGGGSVSFLEPYSKSDHGASSTIESGDDLLREFADTMSNISEGVILEDLDAYFEELDSSAAAGAANGSGGAGSTGPTTSSSMASDCCVSQRTYSTPATGTSTVSVVGGHLQPRPSNQPFCCPLCDCYFESRGQLRAHTRRHGAAPFQCRLCRQQFPLYYKLLLHTRRAHNRNCGGGGKVSRRSKITPPDTGVDVQNEGNSSRFTATINRNNRRCRSSAKQPTVRPDISESVDKSDRAMKDEMSSVVCTERPQYSGVVATTTALPGSSSSRQPVDSSVASSLSCEQCGRTFRQPCTLRRHRRLHAGDGRFTCSVCGRRCISGSDLRRHLDTHHAHKPYVCPVCSRPFKLATSLALHRRLHSSAALQCAVCSRQFDRRDSLAKHMDTHKTERDLVCDVCGRRFKQQRTLAKHQRIMHPN